VAVDATERLGRLAGLRRAEGLLRAVVDHAAVGLALAGMDGRLVWSNKALQDMLGKDAREVGGVPFIQFPAGGKAPPDWALFMELVAGRRDEYRVEKRFSRTSGEPFTARLAVSLARGSGGAPDLAVLVVEEVPGAGSPPAVAEAPGEARRAVNDERLRIARELHDGLGKDLFGLALLLEAVAERQQGRAVSEELRQYASTTRRLANEGRALLRTFREPDAAPLPTLLEAAVAEHESAGGPPVNLELGAHPQALAALSARAVHELGRMVLEALRNVRAHAQAREVRLSLSLTGGQLTMVVEDDGRGLPAEVPAGRYGLLGLRERSAALGGHLEAGPREGGGTRLEARFPLASLVREEER